MSEPNNHEEAAQYAEMHPESNLARCYIDMKLQLGEEKAKAEKWRQEWIKDAKSRDDAVNEMERLNRLVGVLRKFYDWYQNAGSWSNVSLNPEDGTRWKLSTDETLEGERLSDEIDAVLTPSERPVHETTLSERDMKRLGDIIEEKPIEKREVSGQNCNHVPDHNPETGRTYCERCGITL